MQTIFVSFGLLFMIQSVYGACSGCDESKYSGDVLYQPCTIASQIQQNAAFIAAGSPPNAVLASCSGDLVCNDWCVCPAKSRFGLPCNADLSCGSSDLECYTGDEASPYNNYCFLSIGQFCRHDFDCTNFNCMNNVCA